MSLQSTIDYLVSRYDSPDFDPYDLAGDGDATVGMVLLKDMRDALERLSDRMCSTCEGNGYVRNPNAVYSEEYAHGRRTGQYSTNDEEEIDCPDCRGVGFKPPLQHVPRAFTKIDDEELPF